MHIDLPLTDRPWRINVPPPRNRFFEVAHRGTTLICGYEKRDENWTVGTGQRLNRDDIHRWRELSTTQHARILEILALNP